MLFNIEVLFSFVEETTEETTEKNDSLFSPDTLLSPTLEKIPSSSRLTKRTKKIFITQEKSQEIFEENPIFCKTTKGQKKTTTLLKDLHQENSKNETKEEKKTSSHQRKKTLIIEGKKTQEKQKNLEEQEKKKNIKENFLEKDQGKKNKIKEEEENLKKERDNKDQKNRGEKNKEVEKKKNHDDKKYKDQQNSEKKSSQEFQRQSSVKFSQLQLAQNTSHHQSSQNLSHNQPFKNTFSPKISSQKASDHQFPLSPRQKRTKGEFPQPSKEKKESHTFSSQAFQAVSQGASISQQELHLSPSKKSLQHSSPSKQKPPYIHQHSQGKKHKKKLQNFSSEHYQKSPLHGSYEQELQPLPTLMPPYIDPSPQNINIKQPTEQKNDKQHKSEKQNKQLPQEIINNSTALELPSSEIPPRSLEENPQGKDLNPQGKDLLALLKKGAAIFLQEDAHNKEFALMDKGFLELFDHESYQQETKKGNIYLGRVMNIKVALNAVFVDFGQKRQGFLPFSEIHPLYLSGKSFHHIAEDFMATQDSSNGQTYGPSFYQDMDHLSQKLFDDLHAFFSDNPLEKEDILEKQHQEDKIFHGKNIEKHLLKNSLLLVQVTKDERDHKGACLTTYISLSGSASVFLCNTPRNSGISKKITSQAQRKDLKDILHHLCLPKDSSLILRTASLALSKEEIYQQWQDLKNLWITLLKESLILVEKHTLLPSSLKNSSPCDEEKKKSTKEEESCEQHLTFWTPTFLPSEPLYREADFLLKCLQEFYRKDIAYIVVQGLSLYKAIGSFVEKFFSFHQPTSLLLYEPQHYGGKTLFSFMGIASAMEEIYTPKVYLPSGGSLIFDKTEALTAIDVNSGRFTQEKNVHQTAVAVNLEAATMIPRQLRLRNLSGLVVVDFIDMPKEKFSLVEETLKKAIKWDKAKFKFGKISDFCLLEFSRQRLGPSLLEKNTQKCFSCFGSGVVFSSAYLLKILFDKIKDFFHHSFSLTTPQRRHLHSSHLLSTNNPKIFHLKTHPQGALLLLNEGRKELQNLENLYHCSLYIHPTPSFPVKELSIEEFLEKK